MTEVVPPIFHFTFGVREPAQPFSLLHYLCLESCIQVNRPERVYFHYCCEPRGRYWDVIKSKLTLHWIYPMRRIAQDFLRLQVLLEQGGVYADMDTLFVNPLPPHLYRKAFVLGESNGNLGSALIASVPGAEFAQAWLRRLETNIDGNRNLDAARQLSEQHPGWIHVEPQRSFYRYPPTPEGLRMLLEGCDRDLDGVFSFHLWRRRWAEWWRRDLTRFHEGALTEEYMRSVDTTYTLAARRFLPENSGRSVPSRSVPARSQGRTSFLDRPVTRLGELLLSAKAASGQLRRRRSMRLRARHFQRFWIGNAFERDNVVTAVAFDDEYEMGEERLLPGDVVLDVGAHIGVFSNLCYLLGSRSIHCYEPSERNYRILERNLKGHDGVELYRAAVWRSDGDERGLVLSGPEGENTGASSVLTGGRVVNFGRQELWPGCDASAPVASVPLDRIIEPFERVKLLKLDCEGSEFPILLTSRRLDRVERIVAEVHEVTEQLMEQLDPRSRVDGYASYRREHLAAKLEPQGFRVRMRPANQNLYMFEARRF